MDKIGMLHTRGKIMKRKIMNVKIILIVSVLIMVGSIIPAYANRMQELQKQLQEMDKNMKKAESAIKSIQKQKQSVIKEKEAIDNAIDGKEKEISQIGQLISENEQYISIKENELANAEKDIDDQYNMFKHRIRVMYEEGSASYIEILFESKDFSDFLSRFEIVKEIVDYDNRVLEKLLNIKNTIIKAKQDLEEEKSIREMLKNTVEVKKRELNERQVSRSNALNKLTLQEKEYEKALDELEETSRRVEKEIKKLQQDSKRKYAGGKLEWPTPSSYNITSPYGNRYHPITKKYRMHTGIDIGAPSGASVLAANDGVVIFSGSNGGYGKCLIIDHGGGIATLYAHNSSLSVSNGKEVKRGEEIAKVGSTGLSTGPHLHYEVRENGSTVDPMKFYK
jgi:murein DD-endopeptidase MepM/ murein hydrolase activator NlpD